MTRNELFIDQLFASNYANKVTLQYENNITV